MYARDDQFGTGAWSSSTQKELNFKPAEPRTRRYSYQDEAVMQKNANLDFNHISKGDRYSQRSQKV